MQAEERYGRGGYICASDSSLIRCASLMEFGVHLCIDVGNGEYQPAYGQLPVPQGQPNYGATGGYTH